MEDIHDSFLEINCEHREINDAILKGEVSQEGFMFVCLRICSNGKIRTVFNAGRSYPIVKKIILSGLVHKWMNQPSVGMWILFLVMREKAEHVNSNVSV